VCFVWVCNKKKAMVITIAKTTRRGTKFNIRLSGRPQYRGQGRLLPYYLGVFCVLVSLWLVVCERFAGVPCCDYNNTGREPALTAVAPVAFV
jgi:hypothetical protein